jgi:threonylcarbamoyladenosine tRNA methylthiotransferase MtaB
VKVYLDSIGCRLNQGEIEAYARQFRAAGHTLVPAAGQADLAVINTCAVTAAASSDSRQKIRQAARLGAREIAVTGCWSTLNPQGAASLPGVQHVVPNAVKDSLVSSLLHIPQETFDLEPVARQPIPGARLRTRAFIKVQDGCDNRCTFCVTTIARGQGRSLPVEAILGDIAGAVRGGAQEVVLTGVHLGSWGQDFTPVAHLSQLVQTVLQRSGAARLRLSSLEPWDLDAEFFSLWEDPRLCRHLHLPLQSGSAATLRRMARKTTPESFARLVAAAREAVPDMAITTDIIVGFPGETETEFQESLDTVRGMRFAGGHVFTYSPRAGTAAARMPGQVPPALRKERSAQVRAALSEASLAYQAGHIGQVLPVLWESATAVGPQGWRLSGLTDNYLRVQAEAGQEYWNRITPVLITSRGEQGLAGSVHGSLHLL